jgi:ferritin-like metal-binding protein YciE
VNILNTDLHLLFITDLKKLYTAEKAIVKALPSMAEAATDLGLQEAFLSHLEETKNHVSRLETILASLEESTEDEPNAVIEALLADGEKLISKESSEVLDAALIGAAQKVEHFEIACYGTLIAWAKEMEHTDEADLLKETLKEEEAADKKLTKLAEGTIFSKGLNQEAEIS